MREILFRGKTESGEWVYGFLYCFYDFQRKVFQILRDRTNCIPDAVEVIPETVGQFTGLTDKNGKKIFEGDIIRSDNGKQWAVSVVKFGEYVPKMFYRMLEKFSPGRKHLPSVGFYAKTVDKGEELILFQSPCVTVIGNIHDNPELLEVTDNA